MIETLGGPVIAMILFLMPMYAIQKVPAMRKYSGHVSNVFVVIMGLIAISAIFYPCTPCSDCHPRRLRTAHSSSLTESNGRIMISVFDIFKIGIGPSSSHTVGPMKAGKQFTDDLIARGILHDVTRVVVDVYGSLSLTGKATIPISPLSWAWRGTCRIPLILMRSRLHPDVNTHGRLLLANGEHEVEFPVDHCMNFHADNLSLHENGMRITALAGDKAVYSQTYYSIGGGFIVDEDHFGQTSTSSVEVPYPYKTAADLQRHCRETGFPLWPDDEKRAGPSQQRGTRAALHQRLGSDARRY